MKLLIVIFAILYFTSEAFGVAVQFPNKNVTDCSSGTCIDYCDFYGDKILPGKTLNKNCGEITCSDDFVVSVATCGVRRSGWCKKFRTDLSLPYPDCCEAKCLELHPGATTPEYDDGFS